MKKSCTTILGTLDTALIFSKGLACSAQEVVPTADKTSLNRTAHFVVMTGAFPYIGFRKRDGD